MTAANWTRRRHFFVAPWRAWKECWDSMTLKHNPCANLWLSCNVNVEKCSNPAMER